MPVLSSLPRRKTMASGKTSRLAYAAILDPLLILGLLFAAPSFVCAQEKASPQNRPAASPSGTQQTRQTQQGPQSPPVEYLGSEVCKTCHEDIYNNWEKTPHWKTTLDTKGGPSHQGCEGCHGPGSAHVAGGGDITKIFVFKDAPTKDINAHCLACHAGGNEHMNALNSVHTENGVSCTSCHSPHHAVTREFLLVKAQPEL